MLGDCEKAETLLLSVFLSVCRRFHDEDVREEEALVFALRTARIHLRGKPQLEKIVDFSKELELKRLLQEGNNEGKMFELALLFLSPELRECFILCELLKLDQRMVQSVLDIDGEVLRMRLATAWLRLAEFLVNLSGKGR